MTTALTTLWQSAQEGLCERVGESRFNLWFKNVMLLDFHDALKYSLKYTACQGLFLGF